MSTIDGEFNASIPIIAGKGKIRKGEKNSKMKRMDRDKQRYLNKYRVDNDNNENNMPKQKWSSRSISDDEYESDEEEVHENVEEQNVTTSNNVENVGHNNEGEDVEESDEDEEEEGQKNWVPDDEFRKIRNKLTKEEKKELRKENKQIKKKEKIKQDVM